MSWMVIYATRSRATKSICPTMSSPPALRAAVRGAWRLVGDALSGCTVRARQANGVHRLRIDGYSLVDGNVPNNEAITSSSFRVGGRNWQLLYYPNGVRLPYGSSLADHGGGFVSANLKLVDGYGAGEATAAYRVSILDRAGNPVYSRAVGPVRFDPFWSDSERTGIQELVAKEELKKSAAFILEDDCLNVQCDVAVIKIDTKPHNREHKGFGNHCRRLVTCQRLHGIMLRAGPGAVRTVRPHRASEIQGPPPEMAAQPVCSFRAVPPSMELADKEKVEQANRYLGPRT